MSLTSALYVGLAALFGVSAAVFFGAGGNEFVRDAAAIPMIGSLFGALIQILRDIVSHDRAQLLQSEQLNFALGASSHMASIAFDKHVAFCEAYMKKAQDGLIGLLRAGATEKALDYANDLLHIRQAHIVWLTPEIEARLETFEQAMRGLGADAGFVKSTEGSAGYGEQRQRAIDRMYKTFAQVTGMPAWAGEPLTDELAVTAVVRHLRKVLGTEELTKMRQAIVAKASSGLQAKG